MPPPLALRVSGSRDSTANDGWANRFPALAAALGRGKLAAHLPFEIGDEGGCAEWPAGSDMLAQHVELPTRRVAVEEAAPVGDQIVEGARLDERVMGDAEMRTCAGPGPVLGPCHQSRPIRVAFDVAQGRERVRLVHGAGTEAALPQIAAPPLAPIDDEAVATMGVGDCRGHRLGGWRHEDQMDVVRHQAPCPDGDLSGTATLTQQLDIKSVVVVTEAHRLAPIAALGDVMRHVRDDGASSFAMATPWQKRAMVRRVSWTRISMASLWPKPGNVKRVLCTPNSAKNVVQSSADPSRLYSSNLISDLNLRISLMIKATSTASSLDSSSVVPPSVGGEIKSTSPPLLLKL
jgi:hypothetical protein